MATMLRNGRCATNRRKASLRSNVGEICREMSLARTLPGTAWRDARSVLLFLQSLEVVSAVLHQFLSAQALITADKRILL